MDERKIDKVVNLAKRRGFIFPSSEIYGGLNSIYDYGPLGVAMKNNLKKAWWDAMTSRLDIVGLDSAILMHPQIWQASGHVEGFSDPLALRLATINNLEFYLSLMRQIRISIRQGEL